MWGELTKNTASCNESRFRIDVTRMQDLKVPKLSKFPFFVGDALLLGLAVFIVKQSQPSLGSWQAIACVLSVAIGAGLAILPYVLEYRSISKAAEAAALTSVTVAAQNLESVAAQIGAATGQWQTVNEKAGETATAARQIAERMSTEVKGFAEFMQRANDSEKSNLRLETEKLRRAEAEWLQVVVRMLDHVFALHQAAVVSGKTNLIDQMTQFQSACRDVARRVGLTPFIATEAEAFDSQRHQPLDGKVPAHAAKVAETMATGYTFQGRLLRPAVVRIAENGAATLTNNGSSASPDAAQSQLELAAVQDSATESPAQ
jgi:molecular chaperone GrpE (heat shock protein)